MPKQVGPVPEQVGPMFFNLYLKIEPGSPSASDNDLQKRLAVVAYLGGFDAAVASILSVGLVDAQQQSEVVGRVYLAIIANRLQLDGQFTVEYLVVHVRAGSTELWTKIKTKLAAPLAGLSMLYSGIDHFVVLHDAKEIFAPYVEPQADSQKAKQYEIAFGNKVRAIVGETDGLLDRKTTVTITPSTSPTQHTSKPSKPQQVSTTSKGGLKAKRATHHP